MVTKESIIEKHWPRPRECNVPNIPAMKEAIGKMMDEWNGDIHHVSGCKNCPLCDFKYEEGVSCNHPNSPIEDDIKYEYYDVIHGSNSPDWCPLNKESITISKQ